MDDKYKIGELAEKAGVTRRTIHYYIGKGLLPPAEGAGVNSHYNEEHLARIELIKLMQQKYLPLDRIKKGLAQLSFAEVKEKIASLKAERHVMISEAVPPQEVPKPKPPEALRYLKLEPGLGIEISIPEEVYQDYPELVKSINIHVRKLIVEEK
ncbi:MerR family transcriptional regulator [Metallumcola ferriviriculae]|uniref:MerR family transcriptional regulator n=1 Tax=Metallumcola ferriviriculae TaxID=3039180 RepID=A0AAU0UMR5_9FIRM|nr:MerR family transcriptional regulator [Desulfitibacteraceae bacterium MK1]